MSPAVLIHRLLLAITITLMFQGSKSNAVDLIANGNFEAGGFAGWTVASQFSSTSYDNNVTPAASSFYIQSNSNTTPVSGLSTLGPASGSFYALSDSTTPGANVIIQDFTVPLDSQSLSLSFDMFTYDWYGAGSTGSSLNYLDNPNQHVRVDLLKSGSPDFDTGGSYVITNFYDGLQLNTSSPAWQNYVFNVQPYVLPGSTYRLRFGSVSNQFVLNMGVDNVSLVSVPEPSSLVFSVVAIVALAMRGKARRFLA